MAPRPTPATTARDEALGRASQLRAWAIGGGTAQLVALAALAAGTAPGRASATTPSGQVVPPTATPAPAPAGGGDDSNNLFGPQQNGGGSGFQPPNQPPIGGGGGGGFVSSGS